MRIFGALLLIVYSIYPLSFAKQNWGRNKPASLWVILLVIASDALFCYFLLYSPISIIR